jgi:hypothetical protein
MFFYENKDFIFAIMFELITIYFNILFTNKTILV